MGNFQSSSSKKDRQAELERIQYLGDRYPFGDEEILRLARCYSYLRGARRSRRSFLGDWASFCATLPSLSGDAEDRLCLRMSSALSIRGLGGGGDINGHSGSADGYVPRAHQELGPDGVEDDETPVETADLRRHRAALMQVVEGRILPSGFGRRLERAAFLLSRDVIDYRDSGLLSEEGSPDVSPGDRKFSASALPASSPESVGGAGQVVDAESGTLLRRDTEELAFLRLEKFLEGAADCGRRGARPALTVLFKCCIRNSRGGYTADDGRYCSGAAMGGNGDTAAFRSATTATGSGGGEEEDVAASAVEVLDLAYSISLAASFLSRAAELGDLRDLNPSDFTPEDIGAGAGLCQSLLSYGAGGGTRGRTCATGTAAHLNPSPPRITPEQQASTRAVPIRPMSTGITP